MRRRKTIGYAALILVLALLFCGCALPGNTPREEYPADDGSELTTPTEAPSSGGDSREQAENRVFALYSGFLKTYRSGSEGLLGAVAEGSDELTRSYYFDLMRDKALISKLLSALSHTGITSGDEASEASSGEGSIGVSGSFEYSFPDGSRFKGTIGDGELTCTAEGSPVKELKLFRYGDRFIAWIDRGSFTGVAEFLPDGIRYMKLPSSVTDKKTFDGSAFPAEEDLAVFSYAEGKAVVAE